MTSTTNPGFVALAHDDEEHWLEQRRPRLSATDMPKIASGTTTSFRKLRESKAQSIDSRWRGNQYTEWGHHREPIIAEYVTALVDNRFIHNTNYLVRKDNDNYGATPDMYLVDGDEVITCQIKTTKTDWPTVRKIPKSYIFQCQWEMFVTGAKRCLFVWEPYIVDEDGEFIPGMIKHVWIDRDDEMINDLVAIAESYFEYDPPEVEDGEDFETTMLVQELADVEEALAEAQARVKGLTDVRDNLRSELIQSVGTDERVVNYGGYRVEVGFSKGRAKFDRKQFEVDHPELVEKYVSESDGKPVLKIVPIETG